MTGVAVLDTFTAPAGPEPTITCPVTSLDPGRATTCSAAYQVSQADLDNGVIDNSAVATGLDPTRAPVTSTPSTASVGVAQSGGLSLTKTASPSTVTAAGQTVTYRFAVTNTGNVTVSDLSVADQLTAPAGPALTVRCPAGGLPPNTTASCTATYQVTQADMDHGRIDNSATASGLGADGQPVTSNPSTASVLAPAAPALSVVKSASPRTLDPRVGNTILYSFLVTNTGNVTVDGIRSERRVERAGGARPDRQLPGDVAGAGIEHDVHRGVHRHAGRRRRRIGEQHGHRHGHRTGYHPGHQSAIHGHVGITQAPSLTLVKTADPSVVTAVGQLVTYRFAVTNTGTVTVTGLGVADTFTAPAGPTPAVTCPTAPVAPGATVTCTATYATTQADLDHGRIDNTATATALDPNGRAVVSSQSRATVTATQTPGLSLVKSASPTSVVAAGQKVAYFFLVTNTGNVTIADLSVTDTLTAPAGPVPAVSCPVTSLASGAMTTCTAVYRVTQKDVDAGSVVNSAVVTGLAPGGSAVSSPPSRAIVTAPADPGLLAVKTADPTVVRSVGDVVTYAVTVTNTGNVTLIGIVVADVFVAPAGPAITPVCDTTTLAPGRSATCTATYRSTAADFDHGAIANTATATGTPPRNGAPVTSPPTGVVVTAPPNPSVRIVKKAAAHDLNGNLVTDVGDTITYTFVVTNTGNVTLTGIGIADPLAGPVTCPSTTLGAARPRPAPRTPTTSSRRPMSMKGRCRTRPSSPAPR